MINKNLFFSAVLFTIFILLPLCSCRWFSETNLSEVLTVELPVWPPQDEEQTSYPFLSRWKIVVADSEGIRDFYFPASGNALGTDDENSAPKLVFSVSKNQMFCILAQPVTFLEGTAYPARSETDYFKPAGYLYPYMHKGQNTQKLTWEQGFLSQLMLTIIQSKTETGVSQQHINEFIASFNWKKAQETIEKKISQSIESASTQSTALYNPWLLDTTRLLENLCFANFKATHLNITGVVTVQVKSLFSANELEFLSSFIPENDVLSKATKQKGDAQLLLQKNTVNYLADGKSKAAVITCQSAKKISLVYIYMPIFIDDI